MKEKISLKSQKARTRQDIVPLRALDEDIVLILGCR